MPDPRDLPPPDLALTPAGRAALTREVGTLRAEREQRIHDQLRLAGSRPEFWLIREAQTLYDARVARLEAVLRDARTVDEGERVVAVGSRVTARRDDDQFMTFLVLAAPERHGSDIASIDSPVGRALVGRPVGAVVDVDLPGGRTRRLEITAVDDVGSDRLSA